MLRSLIGTPRGGIWKATADRHIYIVWMALVWIGMIAGFLPDIARFRTEAPPPPFILDFHGVVFFLWLVVVSVQIALVETGKPALHRRLGWWIVGLSALLVPLGLVASMVDMVRETAPAHNDPLSLSAQPQFLGLEFQAMVVFAIVLTLAVRMRNDLAAHKRLMVLLLVCVLDPGTARAWSSFSPINFAGPFGWWLSYFWGNATLMAAMIGWDLWRHGRVHPVLIWGGALIAFGELIAVYLEFAPWWHDTATQLTNWWHWAG
jgi:hypothetical protein